MWNVYYGILDNTYCVIFHDLTEVHMWHHGQFFKMTSEDESVADVLHCFHFQQLFFEDMPTGGMN